MTVAHCPATAKHLSQRCPACPSKGPPLWRILVPLRVCAALPRLRHRRHLLLSSLEPDLRPSAVTVNAVEELLPFSHTFLCTFEPWWEERAHGECASARGVCAYGTAWHFETVNKPGVVTLNSGTEGSFNSSSSYRERYVKPNERAAESLPSSTCWAATPLGLSSPLAHKATRVRRFLVPETAGRS